MFHDLARLPDEPIGKRRQRAKRPESTLIVPSLEMENGSQIDADGQAAKRTRAVQSPPSEPDVEANATQFTVDELKSQNRWRICEQKQSVVHFLQAADEVHSKPLHLQREILADDGFVARPELAEYDEEIVFVRQEDLAAVRDASHGQYVQLPFVPQLFRLSGVFQQNLIHQILNHSRDVPEDLRRLIFLPFRLHDYRMLVD